MDTLGPVDAGIGRWQVALRPQGTIVVFVAGFSAATFDPRSFDLQSLARPPHIERSVRKRQAEYFFGRLAARAALRDLGQPDAEVGTGHHREPLWPAGVLGSITHNDRLAAATAVRVGALSAIGIDIESAVTDATAPALRSTVFSDAELHRMRSLRTDVPLNLALTAAFSAKESFFKAAFAEVRAFIDFDALIVDTFDAGAGAIDFRLRYGLSERLRAGDRVQASFALVDSGTVLTACAW